MTKLKQNAFYRGLLDGLASPFTFLCPPDYHYDRSSGESLVSLSWKRVGGALSVAMKEEEQRHGQTTQEEDIVA